MTPAWLTSIIQTLTPYGLNVWGVASGAAYRSLLPKSKSAVIFANGGTTLWDSFVQDIQKNPTHLSEHQHPFDDFVHRIIQHADPNPPLSRTWIRCADNEEFFLDVRPLAKESGLGTKSHMGMLIHEKYGLWMGIRAVLLTTEELSPSTQHQNSPCEQCTEKPCIPACLGNAVLDSGWDVQRCAQFHIEERECHQRCVSRLACPIGEQYRHSEIQHQYHSNRSDGRMTLAKELGITDTIIGSNLPWKDWSSQ